uniref:Uncharacterized protein n=1 Tax=Oxytricha trifallax TaxID=1172189 RepID=G9HRB9_9SPIT|nr:hypothetical protein [Oxytricha trifallax]
MNAQKKIQIRFHLFLVAINIAIVNNETSYVNTVKRLCIYFDKNKIFFNPNDNKPIKFKKIMQAFGTNPIENKIKNFYEVRATAPLKTQNEVKIHPSYKTKGYGNLTLDGIKTHKPLYAQRSIIENDKERLVYNSIQSNFQIKKALKSYNPGEEDIRLKTIHIILKRLVDEEVDLHYQNESNLNTKVVVGGYFNDNFIKYINVDDGVLNCIQKENLNYNLNNLEIKKWISNKEFNVLLNDDASLANTITYVEKTTALANIFQEYTLTDEIQNEYLYQITENLNLKSNEMQKIILEVKKGDNVII